MKDLMSLIKFLGLILAGVGTMMLTMADVSEETFISNLEVPDPGIVYLGENVLDYHSSEIPEVFWNEEIEFVINDDNEIRAITITGKEFETYGGISVGDSVDKLKSTFDYESQYRDDYMVVFDENTEIDISDERIVPENSWMYITYFCTGESKFEEGRINKIMICDSKYAKTMR